MSNVGWVTDYSLYLICKKNPQVQFHTLRILLCCQTVQRPLKVSQRVGCSPFLQVNCHKQLPLRLELCIAPSQHSTICPWDNFVLSSFFSMFFMQYSHFLCPMKPLYMHTIHLLTICGCYWCGWTHISIIYSSISDHYPSLFLPNRVTVVWRCLFPAHADTWRNAKMPQQLVTFPHKHPN